MPSGQSAVRSTLPRLGISLAPFPVPTLGDDPSAWSTIPGQMPFGSCHISIAPIDRRTRLVDDMRERLVLVLDGDVKLKRSGQPLADVRRVGRHPTLDSRSVVDKSVGKLEGEVSESANPHRKWLADLAIQ